MARRISKDLFTFLSPFPDNIKPTALFLRDFVLDLFPESYELIFDDGGALVVAFAVSENEGDAFCSIAVYSKYVNFGLTRGSEIPDPEARFAGSGELYRDLTVPSRKEFPSDYVKRLVRQAHWNALNALPQKKQVNRGFAITKATSEQKRRTT